MLLYTTTPLHLGREYYSSLLYYTDVPAIVTLKLVSYIERKILHTKHVIVKYDALL